MDLGQTLPHLVLERKIFTLGLERGQIPFTEGQSRKLLLRIPTNNVLTSREAGAGLHVTRDTGRSH